LLFADYGVKKLTLDIELMSKYLLTPALKYDSLKSTGVNVTEYRPFVPTTLVL